MMKRGFVYVSALLMMLILLTLTVGYLTVARTSVAISDNEMDLVRSIYVAEAGVEHALADLRNGGMGNISMGDIDGNSETDYSTFIDWGSGILRVDKFVSTPLPGSRSLYVKSGQFSGAIQVGGSMTASIANSGTLNGDVDARGDITMSGLAVNGTTQSFNANMTVPTPSLTNYQAIADHTSCSGLQATTPLPGIYYVSGNCTISGFSNYNLNGTIITMGTLTISSNPGSFTITPSGDYPAIISNGLTITSTENLHLNGLVYAVNNANLSNWGGTNSWIDGALVVGGTLDMQSVTNLTIDFDPGLNPPFFSGGKGGPFNRFIANPT